ncbi:glycosyl transferase [Seonamhaeicola sp. S2-3]|uniref:glycosyltransferase family 2 protein n=1 Tax=Seonamhaeicola sp. S2-3 TaxID=1936081 RepID=UPI0009726FBC|nr:glycosyltransferase family 2 protein [Seonamhaeicola sp. S2-3]APY11008.1 glycosyl transferase [Seonamhaeicola sp. S2-3]
MSAFKVSIITPTYNSESFIKQTITSILNQTYTNWELILVDDASTDKTVEIINQFLKTNPQISLLQNSKNRGAAISRNKGIEAAKGDFIAFLDADDLWKPDKLKKQIKFMQDNEADVCFSSYTLINEAGVSLNKTVKALPKLTYNKFLKCNYIGNLTGIYNAKKLGKIYAPNLLKRQDWLMWLKAVKQSNKPALGIKEPLAIYRVRKNSMSSNKLNLVKYNYLVYRKGLGFSVVKSVYYFVVFLFEYFFVKSKQMVTST